MEQEITKALFQYFSGDEWACFDQLRLGSGWDCERTIDFFAMHVFPSKNHESLAIEIKVSKSDFSRDKCAYEKRLPAMIVSDFFFYVAPKGVLDRTQMPKGTALWEYDLETKRMEKMPRWPRNKVARISNPSMSFVAAILRRQCRLEYLVREQQRNELEVRE